MMFGNIYPLAWAKRDSIPTNTLKFFVFALVKSTIFAKKENQFKMNMKVLVKVKNATYS